MAKSKKDKTPPKAAQDSIEVIGHIPASGGPITRFLTTQHYRSFYLYAERDAGQKFTLIDVTKPNAPAVLAEMPIGPAGQAGSLSVVAGTAALVTTAPETAVRSTSQTLRIMDFSNPAGPKVTREFAGVTATARDDRRGVIFIANAEGIWILQQHFAPDPQVEKAYANYVIYGPSMFPPDK